MNMLCNQSISIKYFGPIVTDPYLWRGFSLFRSSLSVFLCSWRRGAWGIIEVLGYEVWGVIAVFVGDRCVECRVCYFACVVWL